MMRSKLRFCLPSRTGATTKYFRSFSAKATFDLSHSQPSNSYIDTSHISVKALESVPSTSFCIHTNFLSEAEQIQLLKGSLQRLDEIRGVSRSVKQRRKSLARPSSQATLLECFFPENCYEFSEAHFDDVIHDYRESHVSSWPDQIKPILLKILMLMPPGDLSLSAVQSHALHLAPSGVILPHIDNLEASGGTILGVSLGATRTMKLQHRDNVDGTEWIDVLLESGSVYVQTGNVRYDFKHSIPKDGNFRGRKMDPGHRLSIMMRDMFTPLS